MATQYSFRIVLAGDSGVGKTSLLMRHAHDTFTKHTRAGISADFKVKTMDFDDDCSAKLIFWDTPGKDLFIDMTPVYYRGMHGLIVVFDVTQMRTFENVKERLEAVEKYAVSDVSCLLVGNKSDMSTERVVSFDKAQGLADQMGILYVETSAKDTTNVELAFTSMAQAIMEAKKTILHLSKDPNDIPKGKGKLGCTPS